MFENVIRQKSLIVTLLISSKQVKNGDFMKKLTRFLINENFILAEFKL